MKTLAEICDFNRVDYFQITTGKCRYSIERVDVSYEKREGDFEYTFELHTEAGTRLRRFTTLNPEECFKSLPLWRILPKTAKAGIKMLEQ